MGARFSEQTLQLGLRHMRENQGLSGAETSPAAAGRSEVRDSERS